jgi:hypothetical protein
MINNAHTARLSYARHSSSLGTPNVCATCMGPFISITLLTLETSSCLCNVVKSKASYDESIQSVVYGECQDKGCIILCESAEQNLLSKRGILLL